MIKNRSNALTSLIFGLTASLALTACDTRPSDPIAAAQEALAEGEPREAMLILSNSLAENPDDSEARLLMGQVSLVLGNADRAIAELGKIPDTSGFVSQAKPLLAEAYLAKGNLKMARKTMEGVPLDSAAAYKVSAVMEMSEGNFAEGSTLLKQGLAKFPDDTDLITADARRMWIGGKPQLARKRLAPILEISPPVPDAYFLAGQIELADRSPKLARQHFEKVLKVRPSHQSAMLALAAIANDTGDSENARKWIAKAADAGPAHPITLYFSAQMAFDAGDIDRANALVEQMPASMKSMPDVARLEGFIAAARGQRQSAIVSLKRFVAAGESDPFARRVLAENLAANGEFGEAWSVMAPTLDDPRIDGGGLLLALKLAEKTGKGNVQQLRQRIARHSATPSIAEPMRKAAKSIRAGNWAEADAVYAPLVNGSGKENPMLLNNAAAVKSKLGQHGEAVVLARRALKLAPKSPQIMDTLGWSLWQKGGSPEEARNLLTRARNLAPNNAEINEHWAIAHANG